MKKLSISLPNADHQLLVYLTTIFVCVLVFLLLIEDCFMVSIVLKNILFFSTAIVQIIFCFLNVLIERMLIARIEKSLEAGVNEEHIRLLGSELKSKKLQ